MIKTKKLVLYKSINSIKSMEIISSLYKKRLIFDRNDNIISKNLNQSNNCCSFSLKNKDLVCVNYLLSPIFYVVTSFYIDTKKFKYYFLNIFYQIQVIMTKNNDKF